MNKTIVPLLATALAGGVAGGAIALSFDDNPAPTKTVVQQAPIGGAQPASVRSGLTPRDIYKRDAPGVVSVRAQIVQQTQSPFDFLPQEQQGTSTGSGFVVD